MQLLFAGTPKKEKEDGQTQKSIHFVTWTSLTVFVRGVAGIVPKDLKDTYFRKDIVRKSQIV